MEPGAMVRFEPKDSFWSDPNQRYPAPGTLGIVLRVPPLGSFGGSVRVRWVHDSSETEFGGVNAISLREVTHL